MITLMVLNCLAADPTQCRVSVNTNSFYRDETFCEAAIPDYVDWLTLNRPEMVLTSYICKDWGNPA
jgi:hypothetical protein